METATGMVLRGMDDVERLARVAVASGLVQVRRPEEAVVLLLTGHELGLSPMQSLRGIYVVNGRPVLSADLMVAVVRRSGLCEAWRVVESTAEACTIETKRTGQEPARKTWTMADAKRAQVTGKGTWAQYPAQMLRHRCAADLARQEYSDVLMGLYDPDELDGGRAEEPARADAPRLDVHSAAPQLAPAPALPPCTASDLAGVARWYADLALGADESERADEASGAAGDHLSALGYHLSSVEHGAALRGRLDAETATLHDRLACATTADAVVHVARTVGGLAAPDATRTVLCRYYAARSGLKGAAAAKALRAALTPPPSDTPPTGTDAPRSSAAEGAPVEAAATAGAQASARVVLDTDTAHITIAGTWRASESGWREHLGEMTARKRVEASVGCNGAALGPRFVTLAAERIVELDAARPLPAGVARLTVIGVTQTLERLALDGSRARAAAAQHAEAA